MRQSHRYGASDSQSGELHLPAADRPWPVVCLLHGSFWRMPSGREQMDAVARGEARPAYQRAFAAQLAINAA